MAQADVTVVTQLRQAVLNICNYPRGCRKYSEQFGSMNITCPEEKIFYEGLGTVLDQHVFASASKYFDSEAPFQLHEILFSGSSSEGMKRWNFEKKLMSDTDFMLVLKNIKVSEEDQKQGNLTVKEDTPFVNLYLTDEDLIKTWKDFLDTPSQELSSMKLKERFREKYIKYGPIFMPLNQEDVETVDEGPSIAVNSELPGNTEDSDRAGILIPAEPFDFVLAIKCDGWPLCAQEWLSRPRRWPTKDIIEKIIKGGFYIVCKSSPEGNFRLSFSNAERILIQNLSILQHQVYRAFKSFLNHFKKELSPDKKIFCSYHLKTIVLGYCEKTAPGDWNEDTLVRHLLSLIDELIIALKKRFLPMYFMPKYNLMKQIEDGTEVAEKIAELRFSLPSITNAIISEEPTVDTWQKFLCRQLDSEFSKFILKCLDEGKFEPNYLIECFQTKSNKFDEFWVKSVGRIPSRNNAVGERALDILYNPMMAMFRKSIGSMIHSFQNESEENKKFIKAEISKHFS